MLLRNASPDDYKIIKRLYKASFPKNERVPFFILRKKAGQKKSEMLTAERDGKFVGFAYLVRWRDVVYILFLAVEESGRGTGLGGQMLSLIRERCPDCRLFLAREQLDPEAENYAQRLKRHEFYIKNGFQDMRCQIKEAGVVYDVMSDGSRVSAEDYDALVSQWVGPRLKRLIGMRIIEE